MRLPVGGLSVPASMHDVRPDDLVGLGLAAESSGQERQRIHLYSLSIIGEFAIDPSSASSTLELVLFLPSLTTREPAHPQHEFYNCYYVRLV
ncbi:MAG: hypothetical protein ACE5HI_11770 [bacterium]